MTNHSQAQLDHQIQHHLWWQSFFERFGLSLLLGGVSMAILNLWLMGEGYNPLWRMALGFLVIMVIGIHILVGPNTFARYHHDEINRLLQVKQQMGMEGIQVSTSLDEFQQAELSRNS